MYCCNAGDTLEQCGAAKTVSTLAPYTSSAAYDSSSTDSSPASYPYATSAITPYGTGAPPTYPVTTGSGSYYPSYSFVPATGPAPAKFGIGAGCIVLAGLNGLVLFL